MQKNIKTPYLLVSTPTMLDPNFQKSVVLVVEHGHSGAYGFIVNAQSKLPIEEVLEEQIEGFASEDLPVWSAGPVESSLGFVLHNQKPSYQDQEISDGVFLSSAQSTLIDFLGSMDQELGCHYPYRLFVGYSGWGEGQLDEELKQGSWITAPLNLELLFNTHHNEMWNKALASIGITHTNHLIVDSNSHVVH